LVCFLYADKCFESALCSSAAIFNSSDDDIKKIHSETLSYMIYIAHVLPLAYNSEDVLRHIIDSCLIDKFHQKWPLNGWNDGIIGPAQDAVLEYTRYIPVLLSAFSPRLSTSNRTVSSALGR